MQILFLLDQIFTNLHSYLFCLPHEEHEEMFLSSISFCYSFSLVIINSGIFHLLPVYFLFLCKILRMRYFSYARRKEGVFYVCVFILSFFLALLFMLFTVFFPCPFSLFPLFCFSCCSFLFQNLPLLFIYIF